VAQRTDAYRKANLTERQTVIQDFSNGLFISIAGTTAGQTGTFEVWAYPEKGSAEYLGTYSYVIGQQVSEDGGFYADAITEVTAGIHTVTVLGFAFDNGKGQLKMDSIGIKHIVVQFTVVSAGTARAFLRPW
jgi:N-acetylmuramoyl-L-alanine amidase